jgi:hypothetical protein
MDERPATKVMLVVLELLELADGDKKRENSILLHKGFPKLGKFWCTLPMGLVHIYIYIYIYIYIGRKTPYPHVNK